MYSLQNIIRTGNLKGVRGFGHEANTEDMGNAYTTFGQKAQNRERPLGRSRYTWEANITQIFKKQDARVGTVIAWLRLATSSGLL